MTCLIAPTSGEVRFRGARAFLTDAGRDWYTADIQASKQIFARLAVEHAPLVRTIVKALENSEDGLDWIFVPGPAEGSLASRGGPEPAAIRFDVLGLDRRRTLRGSLGGSSDFHRVRGGATLNPVNQFEVDLCLTPSITAREKVRQS